jgi:hypothetical protein
MNHHGTQQPEYNDGWNKDRSNQFNVDVGKFALFDVRSRLFMERMILE